MAVALTFADDLWERCTINIGGTSASRNTSFVSLLSFSRDSL